MESSVSIINTIQIAADIDYLANAKYIKDSMLSIAGKIFRFIVHAGEGVLWMSRIAKNIHLFSLVSKFKIIVLVDGASAISHFLFSADAFHQLLHLENSAQRKYLKIEMAKNIAECTLAIAMIGSSVSAATIGLLAGICIGLELTGLIQNEQNACNL